MSVLSPLPSTLPPPAIPDSKIPVLQSRSVAVLSRYTLIDPFLTGVGHESQRLPDFVLRSHPDWGVGRRLPAVFRPYDARQIADLLKHRRGRDARRLVFPRHARRDEVGRRRFRLVDGSGGRRAVLYRAFH